jgi:hypothetical protein
MPAAAAISRIEAAWKPWLANSPAAASRISRRRLWARGPDERLRGPDPAILGVDRDVASGVAVPGVAPGVVARSWRGADRALRRVEALPDAAALAVVAPGVAPCVVVPCAAVGAAVTGAAPEARRPRRPVPRDRDIEAVVSDVMITAIQTNDRLVIASPRAAVKAGLGSVTFQNGSPPNPSPQYRPFTRSAALRPRPPT